MHTGGGITDEYVSHLIIADSRSFLPQIVGLFYATFDPVAGPTVLHQVPERLISSSASEDGGLGARSPSGSRSRSTTRDRGDRSERGRDRSRPRSIAAQARASSPSPLRISHPQPISAIPGSSLVGNTNGSGISSSSTSGTHKDLSSSLSQSLVISSTLNSSPSHTGSATPNPPNTSHTHNSHSHSHSHPHSHSHSHSHSHHNANHHSHHARDHRDRREGTPALGHRQTTALLDFGMMSEYVIPKKSLHGKLVSFRAQGAWDANGAGGLDGEEGDSDDEAERRYEYRIIGLPMVLEGEAGRYQRNQYMWNVCFVFRASASLAAFEPVVRKTARILRSAELDTGYLSAPQPHHTPLLAVLEQIFEDLNSYSETSIPLDGYNSLELKLFPFYPNPPECNDWDVPIPLVDLKSLKDQNWDITAGRVTDHLDGINHSARIAQLADADAALVRETLRHMLFYQVIMMIDIFQFSNMYTVTSSFPRLVADESVISECGVYVTRNGFPILDWPSLATLYAKLNPGITVNRWYEENGIASKGIDPRRFVSFGIIKGFLTRVHRWPVMVDRTAPLLLGPGLGVGTAMSSAAPDPNRRRVGFQRSGRESRESRDFRNESGFSRTGDSRGESQFTLRSGGSATSIMGVSPGSQSQGPSQVAGTPPNRKSGASAGRIGAKDATGRSLGSLGDTHPSISSRRTNTMRSGGGLSTFATTNSGLGVSQVSRQREGRLYELEDELLGYLDGHHHTDEIQVRMGMSWAQLEKVLGLDEIKNGVGRKGIAVVVR